MSTEHDTGPDRANLPDGSESTTRTTKKLFAGIALALALVFTGSIVVGPQYWNPDHGTASAIA